jgi:hypothetical protein
MLTFLDWVKEQKLELSTDSAKAKTVETNAEKTTDENRVRTGYSANYPPAYVSGQYPNKYFNPAKATADLDKQNMDKKAIVTPKNSKN